jgi:SAM-dependent methyltransferase
MKSKRASKPSYMHKNRSLRNWLVYDIGDSFLIKYSPCYRGVLYDLGCGESPYREFILEYADKYVGVDWEGSLHSTNENVVADLNDHIPVDSGVADSVISLSVIEHLYQPQNMLNEAFRILKPGGSIVLQVPWQWWIHEAPHDYFRYTPYGLKYMFEKAGFKEVNVEPQGGFFTMWFLKFNYFSSRFIRGPKLSRWIIRACLIPFWCLGQMSAPLLDRLDKNWSSETVGYFVTARK